MAAPRNRETHHVKPAAHLRMLREMITRGFIKRVGDSYEITPAGHEYTCALTRHLPTTSTFESNPEEDYA
jgi:DNA-binding IclR family transcriptional regulator